MRSLQSFDSDGLARQEAAKAWGDFKREREGDRAVGGARYGLALKDAVAAAPAAASGALESRRALGLPPATAPMSEASATDRNKEKLVQYSQQTQFVAGKNFFQNDKQWIDSAVQKHPNAKQVRIQFGSPEYFELVAKHGRGAPLARPRPECPVHLQQHPLRHLRMKTRMLSIGSLVLASACALAAAKDQDTSSSKAENGTAKKARPRIEVCFVLDTTGSMGGLIEGAKQKIWSIANEMISAKPTPEIRVGLVAYRDRGDEYVSRSFDLTNDIDAVYGHLQSFQAAGGGDEPESVNEALQAAVREMSWSTDRHVLKIIFLVGDAPPHMDYANGPKYPEVCQQAMKKDLIINTVQCGSIPRTTPFWKEIANLSEGSYAAIPQSGNMVAISTPMDEELAGLNRKLGGTLVGYGDAGARRMVARKQVAAEAAAAPVVADRLAFNAASGVAVQGEGELLDSLSKGKVKLETLKKDELPPEMQKLSEKDLKAEIEKKQKERSNVQAQIQKLSQEREAYLAAERKKLPEQGKADSFDAQVAASIRAEAARKGIEYEK